MPWPPKQRAAIAARMAREGKSRRQISAFFHRHGHGGELMAAYRRRKKKR